MKMSRRIAVILAAVVAVVALAGCGAPPDKAVTSFLDAFKAGNVADAQKYLVTPGPFTEPTAEEKAAMQAIMGKFTYKVTGSKVDGSNATVTLDITSPDISKIIGALFQEYMTQAMQQVLSGAPLTDSTAPNMDIEAMLIERIGDANAPQITSSVSVKLQKTGGEWKLALTEDEAFGLYDAMTGNLMSALQDMADTMAPGE